MPIVPRSDLSAGPTSPIVVARRLVIAAGWLWFAVALPRLTDAGWNPIWVFLLLSSGALVGCAWAVLTFIRPLPFGCGIGQCLWWSVPSIGVAAFWLASTDDDLAARIRLSEPALTRFAEAVRRGDDKIGHDDPPRWIGLVRVTQTSCDGGAEVRMITTDAFLDRYGLVYFSNPSSERSVDGRYSPLTERWYKFFDKF